MACGYRNRERFRTAIYFHLGGLDPSASNQPTLKREAARMQWSVKDHNLRAD